MTQIAQGAHVYIFPEPGQVYRVQADDIATVQVIYGAPSAVVTLTAQALSFGPYDAPAKLKVSANTAAAEYTLLRANYAELTAEQVANGAVGVLGSNNAGGAIEPDGDVPSLGGGAANLASVPSPTGVTITSDTGTDATITGADATNAGVMMPAHVTKLAGVAANATANASDADLRGRATHTGEQAIGTVTGLQAALDGKATAAQGAKADTALQPGALPAGTTLPAAQISDSGAAGRDLLRMATLAEIQSSVSGGAAVAVSAAKTLSSGDRACLQLAAGNPVFTVPGGMPAGWYVPIDGACVFAQGAGTPVILDKREAIAAYPFCVISVTPSGYILVGSKA